MSFKLSKIVNKQKLFFALSLVGILILVLIASNQEPIIYGTIKSIQYGTNKITIYLENNSQEIIIFSNQILNLKQGQDISVYGQIDIYQNKTQIIADKIKCLNC